MILKPFLDLLPYRIDQAIVGRALRKLRIAYHRNKGSYPVAPLPDGLRRLYIDLTVISRHDAGTGIQRVVRALALALIEETPPAWEVHFVTADRRRRYHTVSWPHSDPTLESNEMRAREGDVFFGLDFALDTIRFHRRQLARFRRDGGSLWFLICDLLPAEKPEWFSPNNVIRYKAWIEILAGLADGFLCISGQTEDDLKRVLNDRYGLSGGYHTSIVPMGYDIKESIHLDLAETQVNRPLRFDTSPPFSLMVGTLEPRKGHADILAGFSEMWLHGAEDRLVLVGRMGWKTEGLQDAIRSHPEHGRKLVWFDDVDDLELERIYQACQGVIIGSHAEGFGLPLIEALGHGKPVLARDLPIFRMHEDLGVRYFPENATPKQLGETIKAWAADVQAGHIQVVRPEAGWKDAAKTVLSAVS
uniref:glycosyltransferase n=1 Tax=Novosphingobium rosa TaxID=76978 RepID=UPI000A8AF7A4